MVMLFTTLELRSWNVFQSSHGANITLRFSDLTDSSSHTEEPRITAYKKKPKAQIHRDRRRMEQYNRSRTLSQNDTGVMENIRSDDCDISFSGAGLDISPVVADLQSASPSRVDTESPCVDIPPRTSELRDSRPTGIESGTGAGTPLAIADMPSTSCTYSSAANTKNSTLLGKHLMNNPGPDALILYIMSVCAIFPAEN